MCEIIKTLKELHKYTYVYVLLFLSSRVYFSTKDYK